MEQLPAHHINKQTNKQWKHLHGGIMYLSHQTEAAERNPNDVEFITESRYASCFLFCI